MCPKSYKSDSLSTEDSFKLATPAAESAKSDIHFHAGKIENGSVLLAIRIGYVANLCLVVFLHAKKKCSRVCCDKQPLLI